MSVGLDETGSPGFRRHALPALMPMRLPLPLPMPLPMPMPLPLPLPLLLLLLLLILLPSLLFSQDTFSIVAVDSATGEVGSAGASCITNCIIISDVHPGVGAIHTQASWYLGNKTYARTLMDQGYSPQQIVDSVTAFDAGGDSSIRQYGVVDLVGGGRSAGFTGANCMNYKNHITGPNYSIQGNILLGQEILDSMEARFLREPGDLCFKLMAALQGANVPGADTRCLSDGKPAISSFIRVARPGDTNPNAVWLDLRVNNTYAGQNPIDSLQILLDQFKASVKSETEIPAVNPAQWVQQDESLWLQWNDARDWGKPVVLRLSDLQGRNLMETRMQLQARQQFNIPLPPGILVYEVRGDNDERMGSGKICIR